MIFCRRKNITSQSGHDSNSGHADTVSPCMYGATSRFLLVLATGLILSCSHSHPKAVSPLITHPLQADSRQSCFEGVWYNPKEQFIWNSPRKNVYVAPVNIDYIKTQFPKEAPALAEQFRTELKKDIAKVLEDKSKQTGGNIKWQVVDRPTPGCITLYIAMVKLKATDVGGNIMSDLVSLASPLPGTSLLLGSCMKGDVGIEGRLADRSTGASIMEFKAYNTDPITLFSVKEFERFAFDQENLQNFASGISDIFKNGKATYIPTAGRLYLDPF